MALRLERVCDLEARGLPDTRRGEYPLGAIVLGSSGMPGSDAVLDIAVAMELIDCAVISHYYENHRLVDERVLAGDYRYARGMAVVAELARAELVAVLAHATANVARGHAESVEDASDVEAVLRLRSALFPSAVELAAMVCDEEPNCEAARLATDIGAARESVLSGLENGAERLDLAAEKLGASASEQAVFGEERAYVRDLLSLIRFHLER